MRLLKQISVGGESLGLVSDDVVLDLFSPGRASFVVTTSENNQPKHEGIVKLSLGYAGDKNHLFFIGYITKATRRNANSWHLQCSELTDALRLPCPVSLRHCKMVDVLKAVNEHTGLVFVIPDHEEKEVARFASPGNGFETMLNIHRVFDVDDFIVQQQGDGSVFVGSWVDSYFADRPVVLAESFFVEMASHRGVVPAVPNFRPGVIVNEHRVEQVRLVGNRMTLSWKG